MFVELTDICVWIVIANNHLLFLKTKHLQCNLLQFLHKIAHLPKSKIGFKNYIFTDISNNKTEDSSVQAATLDAKFTLKLP